MQEEACKNQVSMESIRTQWEQNRKSSFLNATLSPERKLLLRQQALGHSMDIGPNRTAHQCVEDAQLFLDFMLDVKST